MASAGPVTVSQATQFVARIKKEKIRFVDLRFTDNVSKFHHVTLPANKFSKELIRDGKPFDGSSITGWKGIEDSDMLLSPDLASSFIDPFMQEKTMVVICDVKNTDLSEYNRCPRTIAKRVMAHLKNSNVADEACFGPELEFFVFDGVRWKNSIGSAAYEIDSSEASWQSDDEVNCSGHRPGIKGGYFPVPPVDSLHDLRSEICSVCEQVGLSPEVHHHEVATAGQCEIGTRFGDAVGRGDSTQIFKYVVRNVALRNGKTATFMPKPLAGDNGSGMHVHMSLTKRGRSVMAGNEYAGLSVLALHFIGGLLKHARAVNAFTNPTTNSYKRLIPGFEAPTILSYSARNRSVSVRIPHVASPQQRRVEVRFPDCTANNYLAFSAMLLAGLDGIQNEIDPGKPGDRNMYALSEAQAVAMPQVCGTLNGALTSLNRDRKFLTASKVFDDDFINAYIDLKMIESLEFRATPHPIEFEMYYNS